MKSLGKVVWQDGMHLSQHHFQAQSRYFEELIQFVVTSLEPDAYGLTSLAFDAEALKNDSLVLTLARGVMPDGLPFNFPHEPLPEARRVREIFSPTHPIAFCSPVHRMRRIADIDFNDSSLNVARALIGTVLLVAVLATYESFRQGKRIYLHEQNP